MLFWVEIIALPHLQILSLLSMLLPPFFVLPSPYKVTNQSTMLPLHSTIAL